MEPIAYYTIDDLKEGQEVEIERLITVADIKQFAELTQDFHPLHTSIEYAQSHGFDNIMAHGLLLSSYTSYVIGMKLPGERAIIMSQSFRYRKPAYPGNTFLIKASLSAIDLRFSHVEILIRITAKNDNRLIASGKYLVKVR